MEGTTSSPPDLSRADRSPPSAAKGSAPDLSRADEAFLSNRYEEAARGYRLWLDGGAGGQDGDVGSTEPKASPEARWRAMFRLGQCCISMEDPDEAEMWLQRAGRLIPWRPDPYLELMDHFRLRGATLKAMGYAERAAASGERAEQRSIIERQRSTIERQQRRAGHQSTSPEGQRSTSGGQRSGGSWDWYRRVLFSRAICTFYMARNSTMEEGARACMGFLDADLTSSGSTHLSHPARRTLENLQFYISPLTSLPGATLRDVQIPPEELARLCPDTPYPSSISMLEGEAVASGTTTSLSPASTVWLCVRCVNYRLSPEDKFIIDPGPQLRSRNLLARVPMDALLNGKPLTLSSPLPVAHPFPGVEDRGAHSFALGMEDVRLFRGSRGEVRFVAAQMQYSPHGKIRQMRGELRVTENKLRVTENKLRITEGEDGEDGEEAAVTFDSPVLLEPPLPTSCEKNWIPLPSHPHHSPLWIYSWHPLRICREERVGGAEATAEGPYLPTARLRVETEYATPALWKLFRGSSVPVRMGERELWMVVHFKFDSSRLHYAHALVVLDAATYAPLRTSVPFYFAASGTVEYCIGMIPVGTTPVGIMIPTSPASTMAFLFSTRDGNPRLLTVPLSSFRWVDVPLRATPSRPIALPDLPRPTAFVTCVYRLGKGGSTGVDQLLPRLSTLAAAVLSARRRLHVFCDASSEGQVRRVFEGLDSGRFAGLDSGLLRVHVVEFGELEVVRRVLDVEQRQLNDSARLPDRRNEGKDTREFLLLMNAKPEFLRRARESGGGEAGEGVGAYVWIDAGITKLRGGVESELPFFVDAVGREMGCGDGVVVAPGMWERGATTISPDAIHWRFAGGVLAVSESAVAWFEARHMAQLESILTSTGKLTWEVNVWAAMEADNAFHQGVRMVAPKCRDHDVGMFTAVVDAWKG